MTFSFCGTGGWSEYPCRSWPLTQNSSFVSAGTGGDRDSKHGAYWSNLLWMYFWAPSMVLYFLLPSYSMRPHSRLAAEEEGWR